MKKFLLWLLMVILIIAAILGGTGYYFYRAAGPDSVEQPVPLVMGQPVPCTGGDMRVPVLSGVFFKRVAWAADTTGSLLSSDSPTVAITAPEGASATRVQIKKYTETVFEGTLAEYAAFAFTENGSYEYRVVSDFAKAEDGQRPRAYGSLTYEFKVQVSVQMDAALFADRVKQGDLVAVRVTGNLDNTRPTAESALGKLNFILVNGRYTAYLAVPHNQETGEYEISVNCGSFQKTLKVTVDYLPYQKISVANAAALPDAGYDESAAAVEEYRSAVWPLYDSILTEPLWDGKFTEPVTGTVRFDYGVGTLLPGQKTSTRHSGRDYQVNALSTVAAPNGGKIVFSGYLKLTGNTVIIEHGGGLKSYLFYLTERSVQTGDTVTKGQTIGILGSVSEGASLHFELRVGNKSLSPAVLLAFGNALLWE